MPLPATTYDSATTVNPASGVTDFSMVVDLSRLSAAAWAAVDTTDGTRGRAAKADGTELPCDWIDFDPVAKTGLLVVKWTGTLASSGTQTLRIYPPNTANAAVAASATYGSFNAYDANWGGYWPLVADGNDRTANGNHGAAQNGLTFGGAAGLLGNATDFVKASDQYAIVTSDPSLDASTGLTMSALAKGVQNTWNGVISRNASGSFQYGAMQQRGTSDDISFRSHTTSALIEARGGNFTAGGTWHLYDGIAGPGGVEIFEDGVSVGSAAGVANLGAVVEDVWLGRSHVTSQAWNGQLQHLQYHTVERSQAWRDQFKLYLTNQAAAWGTWTNTPAPSTGRRKVMVIA